jgi:hypothetical protein
MFGSSHQLCVTIGSLVAALFALSSKKYDVKNKDDIKDARKDIIWRIGYGIPLILSLLQMIFLLVVYRYESPHFYVDKDDSNKTKEALRRIYNEEDASEVQEETFGGRGSSISSILASVFFLVYLRVDLYI